ncbi:hypothetical protein [Natranaeroarchaeum aerophilus]|uniref:Uncharacterized protein n=1 Tax=Natranaeroarchaeum aerophilus TaxID=2917711 RepID=A0AAE3FSJ0_9EURY|nr:hypothetical protein [Natranaeroarchaeum aerophilus]MCL9814426.1 hypothetical protein [Natranaeroarchaeum aerophilus]
MNREYWRNELPHLLAIVLLVLVSIQAAELLIPGGLSFWIGLVVAMLVGLFYRPLVERLGYAPDHWD